MIRKNHSYDYIQPRTHISFSFPPCQDKGAPDSVKFEYQGKAFNARLAVEDGELDVIALLNQPGADGFSLDSTPLFEVPGCFDTLFVVCLV